jgi:hypothetical protein
MIRQNVGGVREKIMRSLVEARSDANRTPLLLVTPLGD